MELLILGILLFVAFFSLTGIVSEINKRFSQKVPAYGGTLREGMIGSPRSINPLLAQADVDRDMVSLLYTGLLRHDGKGNLIPTLAERIDVSPDSLEYTATLKKNLSWSDGKKLTTDDILFTIQLAKNPLIQSPLRAHWEGVEVEKVNDDIIKFRLKKAFAQFTENLTLGILPKHLWEKTTASQFSLAKFNTRPIGAGPYVVNKISTDSEGSITAMELAANKYYALGKPFIKTLIVQFYPNEKGVLNALRLEHIAAFGGISPQKFSELKPNATINEINLQRIIGVFFNQSTQKTLASPEIRTALNAATNRTLIIERALSGYATTLSGPLPKYNQTGAKQIDPSYDPERAKRIIQKAQKDGKGISLSLTTVDIPEFVSVANVLKDIWQEVGITINLKILNQSEFEQSVIVPRRYEALLYGEEIIGKDPDLFAFWHSSQRAHPGVNIALYTNSKVDTLLEKTRTEQDLKKREETYHQIQEEIKKDNPAVFLYSPSYLYITPKELKGVDITNINTSSERFSAIHTWYVETKYVWKIFLNTK